MTVVYVAHLPNKSLTISYHRHNYILEQTPISGLKKLNNIRYVPSGENRSAQMFKPLKSVFSAKAS